MKKKILCLAMIAIMALGIPMTANAEECYGADDWKVTYEKGDLNTNFKGKTASEDVLTKLLPGDTMHLKIKLENKSGKKSDWYMANEVLQSLEEGSNASGGAYTYILTYTDSKGNVETIYSNERVGGELSNERSASETGVGLKQATNMLEEHFYLDRLNNGETGCVNLTVKLDGETQGNDYQQTLAQLQMDFAVEEVSEITHTEVEKIERPKTIVQQKVVTTSVKTGDASQIALFSGSALICGIVLIVGTSKQVKGRKKGEQ